MPKNNPSLTAYFLINRGKELWWHQSCMSQGCTGTPANDRCKSDYTFYMIDHPAVMNRIMSWMTVFYDIPGIRKKLSQ